MLWMWSGSNWHRECLWVQDLLWIIIVMSHEKGWHSWGIERDDQWRLSQLLQFAEDGVHRYYYKLSEHHMFSRGAIPTSWCFVSYKEGQLIGDVYSAKIYKCSVMPCTDWNHQELILKSQPASNGDFMFRPPCMYSWAVVCQYSWHKCFVIMYNLSDKLWDISINFIFEQIDF